MEKDREMRNIEDDRKMRKMENGRKVNVENICRTKNRNTKGEVEHVTSQEDPVVRQVGVRAGTEGKGLPLIS